ncbi:MAG: nuclear transport factor 2 family protein [Pseudomonadota bacterium]
MVDLATAKARVRDLHAAIDAAPAGGVAEAIVSHVSADYHWRGMHPFHTFSGAEAVASAFWDPLKSAMGPVQRRPDIFFAGLSQIGGFSSTWVVEMGHLMGLWDGPWLGIAPSRKIGFLRYCAFHRVEEDRVVETADYIDILNLLAQDRRSPVARTTGLETLSPAPRTHDGLLYNAQPDAEGRTTVELIAAMVAELRGGGLTSPNDHLSKFWTPDMGWYGPGGIGASAFYAGYNRGHTDPFEAELEFEGFTEHVARLGEGHYGGFFGYPSITLRSKGYLGQPPSDMPSDMRIVDLYRREGDKLAENWIFIDLPHFFQMQGIDLLQQAADGQGG